MLVHNILLWQPHTGYTIGQPSGGLYTLQNARFSSKKRYYLDYFSSCSLSADEMRWCWWAQVVYIRKHNIYRRGISTLPPICQQIALYTVPTTYQSSLRGTARKRTCGNMNDVVSIVVVVQPSQSFREKNLDTFFHFHSWLETFLHKRSHTSAHLPHHQHAAPSLYLRRIQQQNVRARTTHEGILH